MALPLSNQSLIFFGWNLAELETLLAKFKAQIVAEGPDYVTSASGNGRAASSGQRMTLKEWMYHLREALQELNPEIYGSRIRVARATAAWGGYMNK